jgi:phytanoyl-CoA hydroxylase
MQTKTNKYFLDSGDKIRFFFEENAFTAEGELKQEKKLSINKIAHGTHMHTHTPM